MTKKFKNQPLKLVKGRCLDCYFYTQCGYTPGVKEFLNRDHASCLTSEEPTCYAIISLCPALPKILIHQMITNP